MRSGCLYYFSSIFSAISLLVFTSVPVRIIYCTLGIKLEFAETYTIKRCALLLFISISALISSFILTIFIPLPGRAFKAKL
jgi:hypothetical protein